MLEQTFRLEQLKPMGSKQVGLAVLGHPISHSISPQIHNAALRVLALKDPTFAQWNYKKIEVEVSDLLISINTLAEFGYTGINLTIPHKVEVLPYLSSIDEQAQIIGAVNTLSLEEGGWKGYNTDGVGLSRAIKKSFCLPLKEFNVIVLGAGGAARAATAQCIFEGCSKVALYNRSMDRAQALASALIENGIEKEVSLLQSFFNPFTTSTDPILLINATSLGLGAEDPSPVNLSDVDGDFHVYDMVYNPPITQLIKSATEKGYPVANGLGMLVGQAARSLEIWTGQEVSIQAMSEAAQAATSL